MHSHTRTDEMEPKEPQDESTGAKPKWNAVYGLASVEIFGFADLALSWERIEGDSNASVLTTEMLENFFKMLFKMWDSTHLVTEIPDKPLKRNKASMSVHIGTWANDAPEPAADERKRKREGKDESEKKETKARNLGAPARLAVSTQNPEVVKFYSCDHNLRMVSQNKVKVEYLPGMTHENAHIQLMRAFDQAEAARANEFNKRLLIALGRNRVVPLAKNGMHPGQVPTIAPEHQLGDRLFKPNLAGPQMLEQTRKQIRLVFSNELYST
ncbi:hypothetical protein NCS52_00242400 [Fusarium sp. LHS14.1]|nr:hypothetical protein NCS52_00242400 [Fusarium sp. LHS14.1]